MPRRALFFVAAVLMAATGLLPAQSPLDAQLVPGTAGRHLIQVRTATGTETLRATTATVEALEVVQVPGSSTAAVVWTEREDDVLTSWYAASTDGERFPLVTATSNDLRLRYGRFDPVVAPLAVPTWLQAPAEAELYIVQMKTQPLPGFTAALESLGAEVVGHLHYNALTVRMSPATAQAARTLSCVRFVGAYHAAYKLDETLLAEQRAGFAAVPSRPVNVMTLTRDVAMKARVAEQIESVGGMLLDLNPNGPYLTADLTLPQIAAAARLDEVLWIDLWSAPEVDMDIARIFHGADFIEAAGGYLGLGVRAEVCDSGTRLSHQEFRNLPPIAHGSVPNGSHGTNTFGQVFSNGGFRSDMRGMMPLAQGIAAFYSAFSGGSRYNHTAELVDPNGSLQAVFQTNSWGGGRTLNYTSASAQMDSIIYDHDIVITQSQSNAGDQMSRPEAWAKNIVSVGGVRHGGTLTRADDQWNGGGSIGPAADGRLKPELASFYDNITTTASSADNAYTTSFGGTSGATPIVAGTFGLFHEMWADGLFNNPVAHLPNTVFDRRPHFTTAKAIMVNTATQWTFSGTGHDLTRTHQGWGNPDLQKLLNASASIEVINETSPVAPLGTNTYTYTVLPGETEFMATLVWRDPAGNPATLPNITNNLDLRVIDPSGTVYHGNFGLNANMTSLPGGTPSAVDTVENVIVANPAPGTWTVEVIGTSIVFDNHSETPALDADFALVVRGIVQGPPPPPPFSLDFATTTGTGDLRLGVLGMPATASTGLTLFSHATAGLQGAGPIFGITPDAFTIAGLQTPRMAGNPFHYPAQAVGIFPDTPIMLPAGALLFTGQSDGVGIAVDAAGQLVGVTRVVRVDW